MQLIQYQPATTEVYQTPLLIIPPWINKYYILDLRQKNSFIKWAVDQGITVFVVSWVNPGKELANKGFEDYMLEGPLAALDAVEKATGEREVNMIGYCLGGTLTASALAWMAAKGQSRVKSVTFFTALLDFSEPGELGVFVDEGVLSNLEKKMESRGYLEGAEMAGTFNMLRANDLIWSFVVNNYLLGKDPFPFDLLYWNSDSTRMPAKMHTFYLRNMYIRNKLREPGGITLAGVPIDLSKIDIPTYFISTVEDHIAPWKCTYLGARLLKGPVRFVLGGSGPHSRHRQPAGGEQVLVLDQREAARQRRRMALHRGEARRLVVERLGQLAGRLRRRQGSRPRSRQRRAESHRGRAGHLRELQARCGAGRSADETIKTKNQTALTRRCTKKRTRNTKYGKSDSSCRARSGGLREA